MHVQITVVAKDYEKGQQATRSEEVEIPAKTLKLYEIFAQGDPEQLLRWVADTVYGTALREAQGGGKGSNFSQAITESGGGRVGGRAVPGANKAADALGDSLGLNVLRAGLAKDRGQAMPPPAAPVQQQPQAPPAGPGPVGFTPPPQQQQMGPGAMGFSANQPIHPGPGPGAIGFGPHRSK